MLFPSFKFQADSAQKVTHIKLSYDTLIKILKTELQRIMASCINNPRQKDAERGLALQKYLLLHSQHAALQTHLSKITPSVQIPNSLERIHRDSLSSSGSDEGYLSSTPSFGHHQRTSSLPRQRPMIKKRRSSLPTAIDETILGEMEEDELKIKGINQQIKSTLTELLNCQSVRVDDRYRNWVQTRLMDTEMELKGTKSRSCSRR